MGLGAEQAIGVGDYLLWPVIHRRCETIPCKCATG